MGLGDKFSLPNCYENFNRVSWIPKSLKNIYLMLKLIFLTFDISLSNLLVLFWQFFKLYLEEIFQLLHVNLN